MNFVRWFVLALALLIVAACGQPATPEPARIRFGETICTECGMIISQPKFAASLAYEESEGRFKSLAFDDIGDMIGYLQEHVALIPAGKWVHDYDSEEWIDAGAAFFVESSAIKSPMGHGLAAFATEEAANTFAGEVDGTVWDWGHLRVEHAMAGHQH